MRQVFNEYHLWNNFLRDIYDYVNWVNKMNQISIDLNECKSSLCISIDMGVKSQGKCPGNQPSCFPCIDQEDLGGGWQALVPHSTPRCNVYSYYPGNVQQARPSCFNFRISLLPFPKRLSRSLFCALYWSNPIELVRQSSRRNKFDGA